MADPNRDDFYRRVDRVHKTFRHGGGFEAEGALGRSYYTRSARRRIPLLGPLAVILVVFIGLKGVIHAQVGAATYDQRVSALGQGSTAERVGAYALRADALTLFVSRQVKKLLPTL